MNGWMLAVTTSLSSPQLYRAGAARGHQVAVDGALGKARSGGHVGWEPSMTAASQFVAALSRRPRHEPKPQVSELKQPRRCSTSQTDRRNQLTLAGARLKPAEQPKQWSSVLIVFWWFAAAVVPWLGQMILVASLRSNSGPDPMACHSRRPGSETAWRTCGRLRLPSAELALPPGTWWDRCRPWTSRSGSRRTPAFALDQNRRDCLLALQDRCRRPSVARRRHSRHLHSSLGALPRVLPAAVPWVPRGCGDRIALSIYSHHSLSSCTAARTAPGVQADLSVAPLVGAGFMTLDLVFRTSVLVDVRQCWWAFDGPGAAQERS